MSNDNNWPYPDSLDALVAAPDHHRLLFENEHVRVLETIIPPGETTPVHTHRWPAVFDIKSWSDFVRRDGEGNIMVDSRTVESSAAPGSYLWSGALPPHTLENVGRQEIRLVSIEVKG